MLKTIEFIRDHSNWRELLANAPYSLNIVEDQDYYLLKYSQFSSDFSQEICRECRGLIIDRHTLQPVALSFPKFFNYCEQYAASIDWATAKVQEKIDGSKILLFWDKYRGQWRVCTSGTLDAYQTCLNGSHLTFGKLFDRAVSNMGLDPETWTSKALDPKYCYTFELVSLENRIVVPYKDTKIYLIGQRDVESWKECTPDYGIAYRPNQYNLNSLDQCIKAAAEMDYDQEGFVVVDKNWNRVKIKSVKYLRAFYLRANCNVSWKRILETILANEQSEFLSYFPEYADKFKLAEARLDQWIQSIQHEVELLSSRQFSSQRDLAKAVFTDFKDNSDTLFRIFKEKSLDVKEFCLSYLRSKSQDRRVDILKLEEEEL